MELTTGYQVALDGAILFIVLFELHSGWRRRAHARKRTRTRRAAVRVPHGLSLIAVGIRFSCLPPPPTSSLSLSVSFSCERNCSERLLNMYAVHKMCQKNVH